MADSWDAYVNCNIVAMFCIFLVAFLCDIFVTFLRHHSYTETVIDTSWLMYMFIHNECWNIQNQVEHKV